MGKLNDSDNQEEKGMRKVERLQVAGAVAPSLRVSAAKNRLRRVTVVDRNDPTKVVGYTTLAQVQESALEAVKIEISVDDGIRPKKVICSRCGRLISVPRDGHIPGICKVCLHPACLSCGKKITRGGYSDSKRCRPCHFENIALVRIKCVDCGNEMSKSASCPSYKSRDDFVRCRSCRKQKTLERIPNCSVCGTKLSSINSRTGKCKSCRPKALLRCSVCDILLPSNASTPYAVAKRRGAPPQCVNCHNRRKPRLNCSVCSVELGAHMSRPSNVAARRGAPPRCSSCARKKLTVVEKENV